ncbi:glycosyltransferase family 25 protein [Nitratireductor sp. L1-7-SE]|uniref:Glycosyltransferase family 25 protein n=1 Tax=Nitratireductor rhodophyticola TaxID=2854036 RepID=A0ABS7R909_9HYPH|nr:glycosyltransferase family 25 protein [Nitratireductor rhodophyticola]MBY8917418.1 glycosyltransferase family 25 protein [Nitratireductor rhodophyticola]MBY8922129.1 glycosyltransferase family 25 protein [Nitratireductor rhodophyticola]
MKTLVINLERETARLAHMRRVFGEQGLDFEVVKAVDAKLLSPEQLKAGRTGKPRFYELGAGEIACFLSHRKCWEIAAKSEDAYTIVCEDDIFLGENAAAIFGDDGWIPEGAGVVRLEACRPKTLIGKAAVSTVAGRKVHPLRVARAGAGAYLISRSCAQVLHTNSRVFCDPVDQFLYSSGLFHKKSFGIYQIDPSPAIQEVFLKNDRVLGSSLFKERLHIESGVKKSSIVRILFRKICRFFKKIIKKIKEKIEDVFTNNRWARIGFR